MLFTTGNLITLGIVLVVLLIYRQLDRDNRSLEKVKKYAERLRDELAVYVDKRAEDLKRYGIELDVHQKAAKIALDRIQGVQEGLAARAGAIEGIEKRLGEYDAALAKLMDMTARVDENLVRLHEESSFTDQVGRKLDSAQKTMAQIAQELPALRANFAADSASTLESFKEGMLVEVGKRLDEIGSVLERARGEAGASLNRAETGRAELERDLARAFERARAEAEKLEDAAFTKLKEGTEAKAARLKEIIEDKFAQLGGLSKERMSETQGLIKAFKADWKTESEELLAAARAETGEVLATARAENMKVLAIARAETADFLSAARTDTEALVTGAKSDIADAADRLGSRIDEVDTRVLAAERLYDERFEKVELRAEELAAGLVEKTKALLLEQRRELERLASENASAAEAIEGLARDRTEAIDRRIAEHESLLGARIIAFDRQIEEHEATVRSRTESVGAAQAAALDRFTAESRDFIEGYKAEIAAAIKTASAELTRTEASLKETTARASRDMAALEARLGSEGEGLANRAFEEFGKRLEEYGSEAEARFERLESAGEEIGRLDTALRTSMEQVGRRVENDFAAFGRALEDRRARFEEAFLGEAAKLRAGMAALEEELAALKTRAYENVSEKLKVFEDDFFIDLKTRGENIEARLESWRSDLDKTLSDLAARAASDRTIAERAAGEEMRSRIADAQARLQDQLATLRDRVEAVQDGIQAQSGMAGEALAALKDNVLKDAADARATAQAYVEGEISHFSLETNARLKTSERDLEGRLSALETLVSAEEARVRETRDTVSAATESLRTRFAEALGAAESRVRSDLESFSGASSALIDNARAEYEAQRDSFASAAQAERDRISKELTSLADRTAELRQDLSTRISQALEGFSRGYESLLADIGKRQRDAQTESESRVREVRDAIQDLSLKLESGRAQSFGKVESEAARLSQVLAEIDKGQKAFIAQTRVFERADEIRETLATGIESMKADLSRLDGRRAEVAELENQLGRVKRLEDEVNQKVTRFLAEKRRIDALEEDFGRLAAVSQNVDKKLEQVTGQADALTEAQSTIRKLLDLAQEADAKYERLEKKTGVLDSTTEAVDKNFQSIQGIEKAIASIGTELRKIPDRVVEIRKTVDILAADKAKADEAMAKLGELDGIIADSEKRIAEVQKAREWLARAETRLEEIDRRAQEQLKLLSTLLKDEGGKRGPGAPPSSVQDTVRKLARQGWSADEIARAVKVSRGEVELILELGAKT